jgi:hypothetical protein
MNVDLRWKERMRSEEKKFGVGGADRVTGRSNFVGFNGILHQDRDCMETNLPEKKFVRATKDESGSGYQLLEPAMDSNQKNHHKEQTNTQNNNKQE